VSNGKKLSPEFSVGITVIIAVVILIGGIIWGKDISFQSKHAQYNIQFPEVFGLKEGSAVLIQGVAHGKVDKITLNADGAVVAILLDEDVVIYTDAKIVLFAPQLMSGRMVTIDPGVGPQKANSETILWGQIPAGVGEVMASSGEVLIEVIKMVHELRETVGKVDSLMLNDGMFDKIDRSMSDLNEMTNLMKRDFVIASSELRSGSENINNASKQFDGMMVDNRPRFDSLIQHMEQVSADAEEISANLLMFSDQLAPEGYEGSTNEFGGSLAKFVYSDTLHNQLVRTLNNLDSLSAKLKKDGVKIKLF
jgi:phospholipid/cholesterol/gamma-HCH transport system substrate-binding protein